MFQISTGNILSANTTLTVKGLAPLQIPAAKGGYFDGYITHAKDLRRIFVTKNFEDIAQTSVAIGYEEHKPLKQYKPGQLAVLHLLNSWARVQISSRISASKVVVYFVDTGVVQEVDISHLYELPNKLKNQPPLAFPVDLGGSNTPEADIGELENLRGAKVAVKIAKNSPNNRILTSEFAVFNRNTHDNEPVLEALSDPKFELDKAARFKKVEEITDDAITQAAIIATTTTVAVEAAKEGINWAVIIIVLLCGLLLLGAIIVVVLCVIRRIRQKKAAARARAEQQEPPRRIDIESTSKRGSIREKNETPKPAPKDEDHSSDSGRKTTLPETIPLDNEAVAAVVATIGMAKNLEDKERSAKGLKRESNSENHRLGAGLSEISMIPYDSPLYNPRIFHPLAPRRERGMIDVTKDLPHFVASTPKAYKTCSSHDLDESAYSEILNVDPILKKYRLDMNQTSYHTAPSSMEDLPSTCV